jgi:hypothetical protein
MKWLKFLLGVILLPLVVAQALTLYDLLAAWIPAAPWRASWFWCTWGGAVVWVIVFFALPRPVWFYVLGHEMTHALAVWLAGGKIYSMQVGQEGGHVATDKVNWWIALAPYFIPLYTLILLGVWISIDFYFPLKDWRPLLFFGIGMTYAFHVTFTATMLHAEQSDLIGQGYLFSGVMILLMNQLVITVMLLFAAENVTWQFVVLSFAERVQHSYFVVWDGLVKCYYAARGLAHSR